MVDSPDDWQKEEEDPRDREFERMTDKDVGDAITREDLPVLSGCLEKLETGLDEREEFGDLGNSLVDHLGPTHANLVMTAITVVHEHPALVQRLIAIVRDYLQSTMEEKVWDWRHKDW